MAPVERRGLADALHDVGAGGRGKRFDLGGALLAIVAAELDLDQLVMLERGREFAGRCRAGNGFGSVSGSSASRKAGHNRVSCGHAAFILPGRRYLNRSAVARSKSSQRWLKEHFSDPYVKRAQAEGWRSRAVFKLEELLERDHLLKPGMAVVDLGAAPGGRSQMVRDRLRDKGRVVALDILPMQGIAGVEFIEGDFREENVLARLEELLGGTPVDLVLSDMAPNMSGVDIA